jgi:sphingomyelin phosphodiesterase 2
MSDNHLRILSLNIWGLGFHLSQDREQRVRALGDAIHRLQADLIGFQEVWVEADQKYLVRQAAAAGLHYSHYFRSGVAGSGLLTLSRFPIVETAFHAYRLKGRADTLEGDFYAGKGIGLTRIQTPQGIIDFYNTHAVAQYAPDYQDQYAGSRTANMYEAATFINAHSPFNPVIAVGDFNVSPHQPGYRLICTLANLTDCYEALHPDDASITFSLDNPYNRHYREPERIDYICIRNSHDLALRPLSTEITLKHQPEYPYKPYSDHYAMQAELTIEKASDPPPAPSEDTLRELLEGLAGELQIALDQAFRRREQHRFLGLLAFGIGLLTSADSGRSILRTLIGALLLHFAVLQTVFLLLFLPEEIQNLKALSREVRVKIIAIRQQQPSVNGHKRSITRRVRQKS